MVTDDEIHELALQIEKRISSGEQFLEDLPEYSLGRRYRENNVVDVEEVME